jgi:hypothetical protein
LDAICAIAEMPEALEFSGLTFTVKAAR